MERYARQVRFPGIGEDGQARLGASHAVLVGCGALGTVLANIMVRAGVGTLTIVDRDYVELSNLQRQILFDEADAAQSLPKAIAAGRKLSALNSDINIQPHAADLTPANVEELLSGAGLVLDGTDNFQTR